MRGFRVIGSFAFAVTSAWLLIAGLSVLELLLAPAESGQPWRRRLFNLLYLPLLLAISLAVQPFFARAGSAAIGLFRGGLVAHVFVPRTLPGIVLFTLVFAFAWDLWRYWFHRLQHAVPLLWLSHRFHHDETAINVAANARIHGLSFVLSELLYLPFLVVFGALLPPFLVTFVLFRCWGFVLHLNVRLPFGRATRWIAGPQWHRVHHSIESRHQDKNFASLFPMIDVLFGTHYEPARDEYPRTGLSGERSAGQLREATVQPLVDAAAMVLATLRGRRRERLEGQVSTSLR